MRRNIRAEQAFLCMNTLVSLAVFGKTAERAATAAQREAKRLEGLFSRFLPGSEISALNAKAGGGETRLSRDTLKVLLAGQACARDTDGCFDLTVGPLVKLWQGGPPAQQALAAARELTGFAALALNRQTRTARLEKAGQSVDLGGVGKGYAADRMLAVLHRHRVRSAFVDLGGNIAVLGAKPDGSPWQVGIRNPMRKGEIVGVLSVSGGSVVTSGDDQRAVPGPDGVLRSHIIDPRTGMPASTGLCSVTVTAASSAIADALATALFTAGMREGLRFLQRFPGTHAIFIDRDLSVYITRDLSGSFRAAEGIKTTLV